MQERLRIGIVGAGRWGVNLIRAFGSVERCSVSAVCDVNPERLGLACIPVGARRYPTIAALLRDAEIDAVVVATPAEHHAAQAVLALEAGKHVLVEKPMSLSVADAGKMRLAAANARRLLMVGHLLRYHPGILELKRLIDGGALGDIRHVTALRLGPPRTPTDDGPWWSLAPHDVSLIRNLTSSEITEVSAARRNFADGGAEVSADLRVGKASAHITVSNARRRKTRRLTVFGSNGTAVFDDSEACSILRLFAVVKNAGATKEERIASRAEVSANAAPSWQWTPPDSLHSEPLVCEARHFVSAVLDDTRVLTDADEGARVVAVLEAGDDSIAKGGAWIDIARETALSRSQWTEQSLA